MTRQEWIDKCNHWKAKWPVMQPEYLEDSKGLNVYAVMNAISAHTSDDAVYLCDAGLAYYLLPQMANVRGQQRIAMSQSQADMGWALPAAIGVAKAGAKNVICLVGDGSFMSNMQELAVIKEHKLPIKIVVLNNGGYLSIKNTQSKFYGGRVHGTSTKTGLWFPDFMELADTFKLAKRKFWCVSQLSTFSHYLNLNETVLIECLCKDSQEILPAQNFKNGKQAPLHDMLPFLSDEELAAEMVVKL